MVLRRARDAAGSTVRRPLRPRLPCAANHCAANALVACGSARSSRLSPRGARASRSCAVEVGIAAAARHARVDDFDDDVDQLEILADPAHRARPCVPDTTGSTRSSCVGRLITCARQMPMSAGGQMPASARPISRSSETGPKKRESSLSARLSPSTKTLAGGTVIRRSCVRRRSARTARRAACR